MNNQIISVAVTDYVVVFAVVLADLMLGSRELRSFHYRKTRKGRECCRTHKAFLELNCLELPWDETHLPPFTLRRARNKQCESHLLRELAKLKGPRESPPSILSWISATIRRSANHLYKAEHRTKCTKRSSQSKVKSQYRWTNSSVYPIAIFVSFRFSLHTKWEPKTKLAA